jgi:hypothetical protein
MLAALYIEALLVDEESAAPVWELWSARVITDDLAAWAWLSISASTLLAPKWPES